MSGVEPATCALRGDPMLPPTATLWPAASSIFPVNAVVVDFPLVPVIAITRPRSHHDASSSSPTIGTPRSRAALTAVCSGGTPGLSTIRSADVNVSVRCPPISRPIPSCRSGSASGIPLRVSDKVTIAPRSARSLAAAIPLRAAPTTVTRLPVTSNCLAAIRPSCSVSSQLQRRQAEQRKYDRHDDEPRDHLRFAPADQLEVMVQRRHLEHSL